MQRNTPETEEKRDYQLEEKYAPLVRHIRYNGGIAGTTQRYITYGSMVLQNEKLGDDWITKRTRAAKVLIVATLLTRSWNLDPEVLARILMHAMHTGLYKDGNINEALMTHASENFTARDPYSNELIITETGFYLFLAECRRNAPPTSCPLSFFGKKASEGEWKTTWEKYAPDTNANGVRYLRWKDFEEIYRDPARAGLKVEERVRQQKEAAEAKKNGFTEPSPVYNIR